MAAETPRHDPSCDSPAQQTAPVDGWMGVGVDGRVGGCVSEWVNVGILVMDRWLL